MSSQCNDTLLKKCFEALKTILQCMLKVIVKPEAHSNKFGRGGRHHVTSIAILEQNIAIPI